MNNKILVDKISIAIPGKKTRIKFIAGVDNVRKILCDGDTIYIIYQNSRHIYHGCVYLAIENTN